MAVKTDAPGQVIWYVYACDVYCMCMLYDISPLYILKFYTQVYCRHPYVYTKRRVSVMRAINTLHIILILTCILYRTTLYSYAIHL